MTLTIPNGGISAGRSANVQVATSNAGAAIAQIGEVAADVGIALEDDRKRRLTNRLRVDLARDMNALRLESEEIGDPDALDQFWQGRSGELKAQYQKRAGNVWQDFEVAFDDLSNTYAAGIGNRALGLRYSQSEADWAEFEHVAVQAGAAADDDTRDVLISNGDTIIDQLVQSGVIDPEEGQLRKLSLRGEISNATAIEAIASNPAGFLSDLDAGKFAALDGETQARYRVQAQSAIEQQELANQKAIEKQVKERETQIGNELSKITDLVGTNRLPVDEVFLASPEVQAHKDYPRAMAAIELARDKPALATLTVQQLDDLINEEQKKPVSEAWQVERQELLTELRESAAKGWREDPIAYAETIGFEPPALPELDANNPTQFATALRSRVGLARELQERGYTSELRVFSNAEREAIKKQTGLDVPDEQRLAMAASFATAFGTGAGEFAANLAGDDVFTHVTGLIGQGLPNYSASDILEGQRKIADKVVLVPSAAKFAEAFHDATEGEFEDQPELARRVIAAARALYVQTNPIEDAANIEADSYAQAVNRALGATVNSSGRLRVGGLQEMATPVGDEYTVTLPVGVSADAVTGAIETLSGALPVIRAKGGDADPSYTQFSDLLASASLTGQTPDFGDPNAETYNPRATFNQLQIVPDWRRGSMVDEYVFARVTRNGIVPLRDTDGELFRFSLKKLVGATGQ